MFNQAYEINTSDATYMNTSPHEGANLKNFQSPMAIHDGWKIFKKKKIFFLKYMRLNGSSNGCKKLKLFEPKQGKNYQKYPLVIAIDQHWWKISKSNPEKQGKKY